MQQPVVTLNGVLGKRLTYLSEHEAVREMFRTRLMQEQDPRVIAKSITVTVNDEALYFNVPDDEKDVFVANLNKLLPDPPKGGDRYSAEVGDEDNPSDRQHDWGVWDTMLTSSGRLRRQLRDALAAVLIHDRPVRVYGEERTRTDVVARNLTDPQLVFQVPPRFTQKGIVEEPEP